MEADLQTTLSVLSMTLNAQTHEKGEQALLQLQRTSPNHIDLLRQVLEANIQDNLQLSAATNLNIVLLNKLQTIETPKLIQFLSSILLCPAIKNLHKRCLERFVIDLTGKCVGDEVTMMIELFRKLFSNGQLDSAFLMIGAYAIGKSQDHNFLYFIKETFHMCVEFIGSHVQIEFAAPINQWIKSMSQVMDRLALKEESKKLGLELSLNPDISALVKKIYELHPGMRGQVPTHYITFQPDLLELNMLKHQACQLHLKMLKFGQDAPQDINPLTIFSNTVMPFLFNSLTIVASNVQLADQFNCEDFCVYILKVMTFMAKQDMFYAVFSQIHEQLITRILIPLIKISKVEMQLFECDSVTFQMMASDTCEKQEQETLKAQAASLLQAIVDSIDGVTTWVVSLCLNNLKVLFQLSPPAPCLLDKESAFMVLTILSCQISSRQDILHELRQFFRNSGVILSQCTPLELTRIYLFMSYNFSDLFDEYIQIGAPYLQSAFKVHKQPTTDQFGLNLVYNLSQRYCSIPYLQILIQRVPDSQCGMLWDIFEIYINKNIKQLNEPILTLLVDSLYQRVSSQIAKLLKKETDNSLLLFKSLNVVKCLTSMSNYLSDKPFLVEKIWMFHQFLKFTGQITCQDQIIGILNDVLIQKPYFGEREIALLPYLRAVFDCDKHVIHTIFKTINLFILFTPIQTQDSTTMALLEICVQGLNPNTNKKQKQDTGQALLLLQLLIFKTRKLLSQTTLNELAQVLSNLLGSTQSTVNVSRTLNCLALLYPYINTRPFFATINQKCNFFSGYDRTVMIEALCSMLVIEGDPNVVIEAIALAVRQLQMEVEDSKAPKKYIPAKKGKKRKMITPNASFLKSVDKLQSPWKLEDKFAKFRQTIETMRTNNKAAYDQLIAALPIQVKNGLSELYGLTCVNKEIRKTIKVRKDVFNKVVEIPKTNEPMKDQGEEEKDQEDQQENKLIRKRQKQQQKRKNKGKKKKAA